MPDGLTISQAPARTREQVAQSAAIGPFTLRIPEATSMGPRSHMPAIASWPTVGTSRSTTPRGVPAPAGDDGGARHRRPDDLALDDDHGLIDLEFGMRHRKYGYGTKAP